MNNTLYITVGLPGSGKSTYVKNFIKDKEIEYLSSDELRAVYGKSEEDQSVTSFVFGHIKKKVDEFLKDDKNVLVDATSVNRKERSDYINTAKKYGAKVVAIVFITVLISTGFIYEFLIMVKMSVTGEIHTVTIIMR